VRRDAGARIVDFDAINQEFTRSVVAEWSDEASIRQQEQQMHTPRVGIGEAIWLLVLRIIGRIGEHRDVPAMLKVPEHV
jgi:hypothetical protein